MDLEALEVFEEMASKSSATRRKILPASSNPSFPLISAYFYLETILGVFQTFSELTETNCNKSG